MIFIGCCVFVLAAAAVAVVVILFCTLRKITGIANVNSLELMEANRYRADCMVQMGADPPPAEPDKR